MPSLEIAIDLLVIGVMLLYWVVAFIILYHLTRFGVGVQPKKFAAMFLFGSLVFSGLAIVFFTRVDITSLLTQ